MAIKKSLASCLLLIGLIGDADAADLPDPLRLSDALNLATSAHPDLDVARAGVAREEANLASVRSDSGLNVGLEGRLEYIEPADDSRYQENNDSSLGVEVSRRIYDFGHSAAREEAAENSVREANLQLVSTRQAHILKVMRAFFDVVLADLEFTFRDEAMAIAYIRFDRSREQKQLGKESELAVLEKESVYEQARHLRALSEGRQRATRMAFALAINQPDDLPNDVLKPATPDISVSLPQLAPLTKRTLEKNPGLNAARYRVSAAEQSLAAVKSRHGPTISAEIGYRAYKRETRSTDPFRAGLVLDVPLFTGGLKDAEIARAVADLEDAKAKLAKLELDIRQRVFALWQSLGRLQSEMRSLRVEDSYRDLSLDQRRAIYQLDMAVHMSDAMAETSKVKLDIARVEFEWMMVQAKLAAIQGIELSEMRRVE